MSKESDLIIGFHSIHHALINKVRINKEIIGTKTSWSQFLKKYPEHKAYLRQYTLNLLDEKEFQQISNKELNKRQSKIGRIPGKLILLTSPLPEVHLRELLTEIEEKKTLKILALDSLTDVQNLGAISRSAAFFGVHYIVVSHKGPIDLSPSLYRIASGSTEYLKYIPTQNLSKAINVIKEHGVAIIGLSEHAEKALEPQTGSYCLILGNEENGISNAVSRCVDEMRQLSPIGDILSLNVSNAAAVSLAILTGK
jgi:23S rRNA (guanosine2251-2'-O)-methyltransferase